MNRRKGIKFAFAEPDPDMIVVSMIEFQGKIHVATQKGVYILNGLAIATSQNDNLVRLKMVDKTKEGEDEQA